MTPTEKDAAERLLMQARLIVTKWAPEMMPTQARKDVAVGEYWHRTFAVDAGNNLQVDHRFAVTLTAQQIAYVLLHEYWHTLLMHTWAKRTKWATDISWPLAMVALDTVVNNIVDEQIAEQTGCPINRPPVGIFKPEHKGKSFEQVFKALADEAKKSGDKGKRQPGNGEPDPNGHGGFDSHGEFGDGEPTEQDRANVMQDIAAGEAVRARVEMMKDKDSNNLMGKGSKAWQQLLEDIKKPPKHWVNRLDEHIQPAQADEDVSWARVHRRMLAACDTYLPTSVGERLEAGAIGVDVSGSMSNAEVSLVFGALQQLVERFDSMAGVHMVQWDDAILSTTKYLRSDFPLTSAGMTRDGAGGTDANHFLRWVQANAADLELAWAVVVTDGHVPPVTVKVDIPVLWLVTQTPTINGVLPENIIKVEQS